MVEADTMGFRVRVFSPKAFYHLVDGGTSWPTFTLKWAYGIFRYSTVIGKENNNRILHTCKEYVY